MTTLLAPLHVHPAGLAPVFTVVLLLAALGSALVLGLGLAALVQRRSRSYLLVVLALGTLAARTVLAYLAFTAAIGSRYHHLYEHLLDVLLVALVVAAVYLARDADSRTDANGDTEYATDGGTAPSEEKR